LGGEKEMARRSSGWYGGSRSRGTYHSNETSLNELGVHNTESLAPHVDPSKADITVDNKCCSHDYTKEVNYHDASDGKDFTLTYDQKCCGSATGTLEYKEPTEEGVKGFSVDTPSETCRCGRDATYHTQYDPNHQVVTAAGDQLTINGAASPEMGTNLSTIPEGGAIIDSNQGENLDQGNNQQNLDMPAEGECCNLSPEAVAGVSVGAVAAGVMACVALKKVYGKKNSYNIRPEAKQTATKNKSGVTAVKPVNLAKISKSNKAQKQTQKPSTSKTKANNKRPFKMNQKKSKGLALGM
jgi:hypothetical protein